MVVPFVLLLATIQGVFAYEPCESKPKWVFEEDGVEYVDIS